MAKQISLDVWQVHRMTDMLKRGSDIVMRTGRSIVLYRQVLEEEDGAYEEIVCTLTEGYVIEQRVVSGGGIEPSFHWQIVSPVTEYPRTLQGMSKERFMEVMNILEEKLRETS